MKRRIRLQLRQLAAGLLLLPTVGLGAHIAGDLFDGDPRSTSGQILELLPFVPYFSVDPDDDDHYAIDTAIVGDVDLVVRVASDRSPVLLANRAFPPTTPSRGPVPRLIAEPAAMGVPAYFSVAASDGDSGVGAPIPSSALAGAPGLVAIFADLDGDGFVGVTNLDGNEADNSLEHAELLPVGQRLSVFGADGESQGQIYPEAGGPSGAELKLIVTAGAFTGPFDPDQMGGIVPVGPAVMTQLPFLPITDREEIIDGGEAGPGPVTPTAVLGVEIVDAIEPDPEDEAMGEIFTLRVDGSEPSIDIATARSGAHSGFALAVSPEPGSFRAMPTRPLRPGWNDAGSRALYEIAQRVHLPDDGGTSEREARIVPVDTLGNITDPTGGTSVTIEVRGPLRIVWPDRDGDPRHEVFDVTSAAGEPLVLDDSGGAFDGADEGSIVVEWASGIRHVPVSLPDPDVDNSGTVDRADRELIRSFYRSAGRPELGEVGYVARFDLNGDGRVDNIDERLANRLRGRAALPD